MKKIIQIVIFIVLLSSFLISNSYAFFFGFGRAGGAEQVIKKGQVQGVIPALIAPSQLNIILVSPTQISLGWNDNSNNEEGFKIERKTGVDTGTYNEIATVGVNVTVYNNVGLTPGTTYYYRIRAYNASGNSNYSNETVATTPK